MRVLADREQEVVDAYLAGASTAELGERFGTSNRTVQRLLRAAGVRLRPTGRSSTLEGREAETIAQYESGLSARQVAARLGGSRETVARLLAKHGVTRSHVLNGHEDDIVIAYQDGANMQQLADEHAVAKSTIRLLLIDQGATIRPAHRRRNGAK